MATGDQGDAGCLAAGAVAWSSPQSALEPHFPPMARNSGWCLHPGQTHIHPDTGALEPRLHADPTTPIQDTDFQGTLHTLAYLSLYMEMPPGLWIDPALLVRETLVSPPVTGTIISMLSSRPHSNATQVKGSL